MDAISKHAETHGKTTTKDVKGNTYILLETASTDCESTVAMLTEERGAEDRGESGAPSSSVEKRNNKPVNHRGEVVETSGAVPTRVNGSVCTVTSALAEGVSTHAATEMAKQRKDTKQPNANVSDSIDIPTSHQVTTHNCILETQLKIHCLWWRRYACNLSSAPSLHSLLGECCIVAGRAVI